MEQKRSEALEKEIKRANKEMTKLEDLLKKEIIPFTKIENFETMLPEEEFPLLEEKKENEDFKKYPDFYCCRNGIQRNQIRLFTKNHDFSIICHYGSWGYKEGLLEMRVDQDDPEGYLTAEEVFEKIKLLQY